MEANQRLGDRAFDSGDLQAALRYYQEACTYPKNLEVAPRSPDFRAQVFWNLAKVYAALKKPDSARDYLHKIVAEKYTRPHLGTYYQALAQKALGRPDQYRSLLDRLAEQAGKLTSGQYEMRGKRQAVGHYLLWLVLAERGDRQAAAELEKAIGLDPRVARRAIGEAQLDVARAHQ